jgi:hypothetical protein
MPGIDRIVWPSGRYRRTLRAIDPITARVLFACGPPLLTPVMHFFRAPVPPC